MKKSWIPPLVAALEKAGSRSATFVRLYSRPYKRVVKKEILMSGLNSGDRILNVGCGAIPFTAVHLATMTGARICALERDPAAAESAARCVHRLGLQGSIEVLTRDALEPFGFAFSAAVVSLQAEPKRDIWQRLQQEAMPGAKFIFRLPSGAYAHHYDDSLNPGFAPSAWTAQPMRTFDRSVLYIQENTA